jgi:hypothetical protein
VEEVEPVPELGPEAAALPDVAGDRAAVMAGPAVTVGKSWDRASLTRARAAKKLAVAEAMFWLEMLTFSSSAFN